MADFTQYEKDHSAVKEDQSTIEINTAWGSLKAKGEVAFAVVAATAFVIIAIFAISKK